MGYNYITFTTEEHIVQRSVSINNVLSTLRDDRKMHWLRIISISWGCLSFSSFFFLCAGSAKQFLENNILLNSKMGHSCKADCVTLKGRSWFPALNEQMLSSFHYILTSNILHTPFNC